MFTTPWHRAVFLRRRTTEHARIINGYSDIELMVHIQPPDVGQAMKIDIWDSSELSSYDTRLKELAKNLNAIHIWCQLAGPVIACKSVNSE